MCQPKIYLTERESNRIFSLKRCWMLVLLIHFQHNIDIPMIRFLWNMKKKKFTDQNRTEHITEHNRTEQKRTEKSKKKRTEQNCKWLELSINCWEWLERANNNQKMLKMAENGRVLFLNQLTLFINLLWLYPVY